MTKTSSSCAALGQCGRGWPGGQPLEEDGDREVQAVDLPGDAL